MRIHSRESLSVYTLTGQFAKYFLFPHLLQTSNSKPATRSERHRNVNDNDDKTKGMKVGNETKCKARREVWPVSSKYYKFYSS